MRDEPAGPSGDSEINVSLESASLAEASGATALRVVFFGPPGAGKGTQCKQLTQRYRIPHLSTGEMLRATKGDSSLGRLVSSYIDGGRLAPDLLVMRILIKRLRQSDCDAGYLLDGFPRTVNQAEMFDRHLADQGTRLDRVLSLEVDQETLVDRLLERATRENRADDSAEV